MATPLGKSYITLDKCFVCNIRQRWLGKLYIGNDLFAEYFMSDTRQSRVSTGTRQRKVTLVEILHSFSVVSAKQYETVF
jgi:hypothetical protein